MESKVSPTYITLVMAYLELKLYKIIEEKYGEEFKDQFIKDWLCFLDDCFIKWDENIDTTENLLKIIQNIHPSIKFTLKKCKKEIDYLDVKVLVKDDNTVSPTCTKNLWTVNSTYITVLVTQLALKGTSLSTLQEGYAQ